MSYMAIVSGKSINRLEAIGKADFINISYDSGEVKWKLGRVGTHKDGYADQVTARCLR